MSGVMKTVLFVCVGNSGRSQMAEAFFNQLPLEKARATSAGTSLSDTVDPNVARVMKEVGIDISRNRPKKLTADILKQADRVVTMGCGVEGVCPMTFTETEDWGLDDPKGKPIDEVRVIRDAIRQKVRSLIEEIDA